MDDCQNIHTVYQDFVNDAVSALDYFSNGFFTVLGNYSSEQRDCRQQGRPLGQPATMPCA